MKADAAVLTRIHALRSTGMSHSAIAVQAGITCSYVQQILAGKKRGAVTPGMRQKLCVVCGAQFITAYHSAKGCSSACKRAHRAALHAKRSLAHSRSPKGCYTQHRCHTKSRGLHFNLTFDQWWALWKPTVAGAYSHSGCSTGLCVSR